MTPARSQGAIPLILVTTSLPPDNLAGTPRVLSMLRYLGDEGIMPQVVTTQNRQLPDDCDPRIRLNEVSFRDPRPSGRCFQGKRLPLWRRLIRDVIALPDRYRTWSSQAAKLAWQIARKNRAPVLVSVPPVSAARKVARHCRPDDPPLFIDFRDAWLEDPIRRDYYRNPLRYAVERSMEAMTVSRATGCIFATPGMLKLFRNKYPAFGDRFHLLLNGYDEADWSDLPAPPSLPSGGLNLLHSGSFPGLQTPEYVLEALEQLGDPEIRLFVLGDHTGKTERLLSERFARLKDQVVVHPRRDHESCLAWQQAADLLLLVVTPGSRGDEADSIVTSKCFEYLRAGRPILATIPLGGDANTILSRVSGVTRVSSRDVEAIKRALLKAKSDKAAKQLQAQARHSSEIEAYRRDQQMKQLAAILRSGASVHAA